MGEPGTKDLLNLEELKASAGTYTGRKHILSILVENKPGVLTRSRACSPARLQHRHAGGRPDRRRALSRITLTLDGATHPIDQVTKQLHKLVNVLKIRDLEPEETVARELAMFKLSADVGARGEILQIVEIFRGRVIDVTRRSVIVEIAGTEEKIDAFERMVRPSGSSRWPGPARSRSRAAAARPEGSARPGWGGRPGRALRARAARLCRTSAAERRACSRPGATRATASPAVERSTRRRGGDASTGARARFAGPAGAKVSSRIATLLRVLAAEQVRHRIRSSDMPSGSDVAPRRRRPDAGGSIFSAARAEAKTTTPAVRRPPAPRGRRWRAARRTPRP